MASFVLSQYLVKYAPRIAFFSLPSRFWELGIGCAIAFNKIKFSAQIFDPKKHLCDQNFCYLSSENKILYTDNNHVGFNGSFLLGKKFGEEISFEKISKN